MGGYILNFIGGFVRWIFGSLYRAMTNKPKFKFREYIYGPDKSDDWFDVTGHRFNNKWIGLISIVLFCWLLMKLGF